MAQVFCQLTGLIKGLRVMRQIRVQGISKVEIDLKLGAAVQVGE